MNTEEQEQIDRFEKLRSELADPDGEALKARFWEPRHQVIKPVVELAHTHTTPSIGRSVLLHMGIDSITTHVMVGNMLNVGLLGKGARHVVLRPSGRDGINIRTAVVVIADGPAVMAGLLEEK